MKKNCFFVKKQPLLIPLYQILKKQIYIRIEPQKNTKGNKSYNFQHRKFSFMSYNIDFFFFCESIVYFFG